MKRYIFAPLILAGLVQFAGPATGQQKKLTPAPKKAAALTVRKKAPPIDPTLGDNIDGEDLTIRRAAVDALGDRAGSVVVVDPSNGRVLTVVNQKLAFQGGYIPCSTIKLVTGLAALTERVVEPAALIHTTRYTTFNLTTAIAHSDNNYFGILGTRLGFERVQKYAQMLGLGEKAGLDIPEEQAGAIPVEPPKAGGMVLQTAYGEGFLVTPLELASLVTAIANGGTLYYLQYPRTQAEIDGFAPKVKRQLDLAPTSIQDLKEGMRGAVDYGTGRLANDPAEAIYGKTGTCTDFRMYSHMGWFGSFNDVDHNRLAVVVMLTGPGSRMTNGPVAAGVAGSIYRALSDQQYFVASSASPKKEGDLEIITSYPVRDR